MSGPKYAGLDTLALHAGAQPDPATGARATPIYQTASFTFPDSDYAASLFNIERAGHVYSRLSNPTNAVLEERIAALDGGVGAIATASGQAAMHLAVATICSAGDHIVSSGSIYGGTHNLLGYTLPRFGIETTFVDPRDAKANVVRRTIDLEEGKKYWAFQPIAVPAFPEVQIDGVPVTGLDAFVIQRLRDQEIAPNPLPSLLRDDHLWRSPARR